MTEPAASQRDPVGLAFGAMAFGGVLGIGLQGLVTWAVRTLQAGSPAPAAPSLGSGPALVLLLGTAAGVVGAGVATWTILAPIKNPWRQAMLSIITGLGSFALSIVTLPIDHAFGRSGLLALAALSGVGCLLIGRRLGAGNAS